MSVSFKNVIAASLIFGLVFPYSAEAFRTDLPTDVSVQLGNPGQVGNRQVIPGDDDVYPRINIDRLAPVQTNWTPTAITTTTPSITLTGNKKQGRWKVDVFRFGDQDQDELKYDATAPACPPAPSARQYRNENGYYDDNGLRNPWPLGLNGEWANKDTLVAFAKGSPILCRDQIRIEGDLFFEKKYSTSNCNAVYYKEDQADCPRERAGNEPRETLSLFYMAGCKISDDVTVTDHGIRQNWTILDKAGNSRQCITPEPRIDKEEPEFNSFQIEHVGLGLSRENLGTNTGNANQFKAHEGPINLHVNLRDAPADTNIGSGQSGLNWEPITTNPRIQTLQADIMNEQAALITLEEQAKSLEADIIIVRSDILLSLATLQKRIISNNLLHKLSGEINTPSNFFMQAVTSLVPNINTIDQADVNGTGIGDIYSTLNRPRLDSVPEQYKEAVFGLSRELINTRKNDYITELPQLLNRAQVSETGDDISLASTVNEFNKYYNQWQIDKRLNYSNVARNWVRDLNRTDQALEEIYDDFKRIENAYQSNDLAVLAGVMAEIAPDSNILSSLENTETAAAVHLQEQRNTLTSLSTLNSIIADTKNYVDNFDPDNDTFDPSLIDQLVATYDTANDQVLTVRADVRDDATVGSLAHSLYRLSASEDSDEIRQIMTLEQSEIRSIRAGIEVTNDLLTLKEQQLDDKLADIIAVERQVTRMTNELTTMVQAQQALLDAQMQASGGVTLAQEKITHIRITRTQGNKSKDFFPPTTTPENGNNFVWDINSFQFDGETNPIFTVAGDYRIQIQAFDQAGNRAIRNGYIKIQPDELVVDVRSNCNNAADVPYADNVDNCTLTVPLKDRFGNNIRSNSNIRIYARDQELNGSYDVSQSLGANFVNGLRFQGGTSVSNRHVSSWNSSNQAQRVVQLRSLLPTLDVIEYAPDPDYSIGYEVKEGVDVTFNLEFPTLNARGAIRSERQIEGMDIPVRFKPWVEVKAKGGMGTFNNRGWVPPIAKEFDIYVDAATNSALPLPEDFDVEVTGFIGNSYEFNNLDMSKPGQSLSFNGVTTAYTESTGNAGKPAPLTTTINSVSALSGQQSASAIFIPKVKYQVGSRNITLPGLPAGTCSSNDCFVLPPPPPIPSDITISSPSTTEPGALSFSIDLSKGHQEDLTVYLEAEHISTSNGDYIVPSQNFVTISAGATKATFNIPVPDDELLENNEQMRLSVESVDKPQLVEDTFPGIGTIIDNDNQLIIGDPVTVIEGGRCLFSFKLDKPVNEDVTINASLGAPSDTAIGGNGANFDYQNQNVTGVIKSGTDSVNISVQTNDDLIANEGIEVFTFNIDSVNGGDLSGLSASSTTCEIEDNDVAPNVYVYGSTVNEGENGSFTVTVGEGGPSGRADNEAIILNMATYEIDVEGVNAATEDVDYEHNALFTVTIPAGENSVQFTNSAELVTNTDDIIEDDEVFGIRAISVRNGATVGSLNNARANIIIRDGNEEPDKPTISSIEAEDAGEATPEESVQFRVNLDSSNNSAGPITLNLELMNGTAEGGDDFDDANVSVTIPQGATWGLSEPVTIYDDEEPERDEDFQARVIPSSVSPSGAIRAIGATPNSNMSVIKDNDMARSGLIINESQAKESLNGDNVQDGRMNFTVALTHPLPADADPLVVNYTPSLITPSANPYVDIDDYTATFVPGGDRVVNLQPVRLFNNLEVDGDKEFEMNFTGVESGDSSLLTAGLTSKATGRVLDDDIDPTDPPVTPLEPEIVLTGGTGTEGEVVDVMVGLTAPAIERTVITLATVNDSTDDNDYLCPALDLTVIFAEGENEPQRVRCELNIDDENEALETFEIVVSNVSGQIKAAGDNDKAEINIINYQRFDLEVVDPGLIPEDIEGGVANVMVQLTDNGNPLSAEQSLEQAINFTIDPEDITAVGGLSFVLPGVDYNNSFINLTLEPGKGSGATYIEFPIAINNDSVVEINPDVTTSPENRYEQFRLPIEATGNNVKSLTETVATIVDEDRNACSDKPQVRVHDAKPVTEGGTVEFDISLDRTLCAGSPSITLNFSTSDIGAEAGDDFVNETFAITINGGERYADTITVNTIDDSENEPTEDFGLKFDSVSPSDSIQFVERFSKRTDNSNLSMGRVAPDQNAAIGYINDNDDPAPSAAPTLTIGDTTAIEGSDLLYEVRLSEKNTSDTDIEVELIATPGDNTVRADFTSGEVRGSNVLATMIIRAGEELGILEGTTIESAVINTTDNTVETNLIKRVNLAFRTLIDGVMTTTGIDAGTGSIIDNDALDIPNVVISGGSANEGDEIEFTIALENPTGSNRTAPEGGLEFEVMANTISGPSAASSSDFEVGAKTVILSEGSSTSFRVKTNEDDLEDEGEEQFNVRITSVDRPGFIANSGDITSNNLNATGTILDIVTPDECVDLGINCPEEIYLPGAAIEGQLIADEVVCEDGACDSTDDESIVLGTSTVATDIREEITRNIYELIRGRIADNLNANGTSWGSGSPQNDLNQNIIENTDFEHTNSAGNTYDIKRWDIYLNDLPDGGVTYLDGRGNGYFRIGVHRDGALASPARPVEVSGKHTIIVRNGSLNVVGDLVYANPEASLGVMVINDRDDIANQDNMSRRGQLTVYRHVKHMVGAYYTDGSLVSNIWADAGAGGGRVTNYLDGNPNNDWDIVNNNGRLGRQLILTGNILSKNTIGKADKTPPEGPWGDLDRFNSNERLPRAQMYDFNYIRRYVPVYSSPGELDAASRNRCTILPGQTECYANTKSFIIRVDPRLRENPPPGFQASGIQSLR